MLTLIMNEVLSKNIPTFIRRHRTTIAQCAGTLSGAAILFGFFLMFPQFSPSKKDDRKKEEVKDDRGDIWDCQTNIWQEAENLFKVPVTTKRNNEQELISSIKSSLFLLEYHIDGHPPQRVLACAIGKGRYLTVGHAFLTGASWRCVARFGHKRGKLNNAVRFILHHSKVYHLENDQAIFLTDQIVPRKDLSRFLPQYDDICGRDGMIIGMNDDGSYDVGYVETTFRKDTGYFDNISGKSITGQFMLGKRLDRDAIKGDCGSLVISKSHKGYFISGMHCAGSRTNKQNVVFTQLSLYRIDNAHVPQGKLLDLYEDDSYFSKDLNGEPILVQNSKKTIADWMTPGFCNFLGCYHRRIKPKSRTKPTMICDDVVLGFNKPCIYSAPCMKAFQREGEWFNPFTLAANKQSVIPPYFEESLLDYCVSDYLNKCLFDKSWLKKVKVESLSVAINGIKGNDFVHPIKRSTSGGHLFPGSKVRYMIEGLDGDYSLTSDVQRRVDYIETQYKKGHRVGVLFDGTLKDETVTKEKCDIGKTRVFTACDMAFCMVVRRQYIRITEAIMRNNFITECAAGMDHYEAWPRLFLYLTKFGDSKIVAGDYSSFDKCMPPILIQKAFEILDVLREQFVKLEDDDIMISRGIRTDIAFPITNFNGDVFQFFGGNSSGHPLTVIINSLVNSLYVRYVYYNSDRERASFNKEVRLMTLGDDNIFGSNDPSFNHTSLSEGLSLLGIKYTMADKKADSVPFLNIYEVDFLKRKFSSIRGACVAPLALDSVFRSLMYFTEEDNVSEEKRLADTYLSARREWCLHGEDVFNRCVDIMDKILNKYPRVKDFYIDKHHYNWLDTLLWCFEDKQLIVLDDNTDIDE